LEKWNLEVVNFDEEGKKDLVYHRVPGRPWEGQLYIIYRRKLVYSQKHSLWIVK
jgi:hypothetical protein